MKTFSQVLRNNVTLIAEPVVSGKTCAIGFWFSIGSRNEAKEDRGVTHFVEHMLFKGTETLSSYGIASSFDRIGGYINAFTEREDVCVYCVVPSAYAGKAFSIMSEMAERAVFDSSELEKERKVVQTEIVTSRDDPEEAALDAVSSCVWPRQALSQTISGSVKDIARLSRKKLFDWYEKYFKKGELCICISGGFDLKEITELSEKLGVHEPFRTIHYDVDVKWKPGINFIKADFQQEQFFLLFPLNRIETEKDYYSFLVLNAIIGDTMSSRLFQRLREKGGYCYNVYSFLNLYEGAGSWYAYASSAKSQGKKLIEDLFDEMRLFFTNPPSQEEIQMAKEHLAGEELIASDDVEYRMKRLYRNFLFGFKYEQAGNIIKKIRDITFDDVMNMASKLFVQENMAFVVFGPDYSEKDKRAITNVISKACSFRA